MTRRLLQPCGGDAIRIVCAIVLVTSCSLAAAFTTTTPGNTAAFSTRTVFHNNNNCYNNYRQPQASSSGRRIRSHESYRVAPISRSASRRKSVADDAAASSLETSPHESEGTAPPFPVTLEADDYSYTDAIKRTLGWVGASTLFGGVLWATAGSTTGEEFFAGYLVEQSLSVDNLFVFLLLFEYFKVPLKYQDRVLNWGIYGAIIMRGIMIGIGAAALQQFHAILLLFAGILIYSSAQFFISGGGSDEEDEDPSNNSIVKFSNSLLPSSKDFDGKNFFTMEDGIRKATPLFICMIAVEISDVVFAVDSIPAVFGVTENPLVVFSSNLFAIMGLRSLYTILSKAATDLKYLEPAVAVVLGFIGCKMVGEYFGYEIPTNFALAVVGTVLVGGVGASVWEKQRRLAGVGDGDKDA